MQVAHGEFGAGDMDGEIDLAPAAEVLDVTIPAMFGAALVTRRGLAGAALNYLHLEFDVRRYGICLPE